VCKGISEQQVNHVYETFSEVVLGNMIFSAQFRTLYQMPVENEHTRLEPSFLVRVLASKRLPTLSFLAFMIGVGLLGAGVISAIGTAGISLAGGLVLLGGGGLLALAGGGGYVAGFFARKREKGNEGSPPPEQAKEEAAVKQGGAEEGKSKETIVDKSINWGLNKITGL
jgi:hypothetical protein